MSWRNGNFFKAISYSIRWSYLFLASILSISLIVISILFSGGESALYLPGENNAGAIMLWGLLMIVAFGILVWGGVRLLVCLCRRSFSMPHACGMAFLACGFLGSPIILKFSHGSYLGRLKNELMVVDEASYLRFAQSMRAEMEKQKDDFVTFDSKYSGHEGLPVRPECERILGESPLTMWPRQFLGVRLEKDSVILSRGTGMLGQIGVVIFDKGPLRDPQGPDYPRPNSYCPVEYRLFPSVFVFTSD